MCEIGSYLNQELLHYHLMIKNLQIGGHRQNLYYDYHLRYQSPVFPNKVKIFLQTQTENP